jgi:hypothetical protein
MDPITITILLDLYKEQRAHGRQHETQRQLVTAAVVALTVALLSAMAALKFQPAATFLLGIAVIAAGVLGRLFSEKYYERFKHHWALARAFLNRIDELCPEAEITQCKEEAYEDVKNYGTSDGRKNSRKIG